MANSTNRILAGERNEDDDADLGEEIVAEAAQPERDHGAQEADGDREQHGQRHAEALIERHQEEIGERERDAAWTRPTKVPAGVTLFRTAAATVTEGTAAAAGTWSAFCERSQPQSAAPKRTIAPAIPPPGGRRIFEIPRRNSLKTAKAWGASNGRAASRGRENRVNGRRCARWRTLPPTRSTSRRMWRSTRSSRAAVAHRPRARHVMSSNWGW